MNILSNRIVKDFISLVANRGLDSLIGIIVIPYLIDKIGSAEYGKIVLAQSIAYLGVSFVNFGSDLLILKKNPIIFFLSENISYFYIYIKNHSIKICSFSFLC